MTTTESDGELLARLGTDGEAWAIEFMDRAPGGPVQRDLDTVRAWFANANEAGRTAANSKTYAHGTQIEALFGEQLGFRCALCADDAGLVEIADHQPTLLHLVDVVHHHMITEHPDDP